MDTLNKYLELDKQIQHLEGKNVRGRYKEVKDELDNLTKTIKILEEKFVKVEKKMAKEKEDVDKLDVKSFVSKCDFEKEFNKEQYEYLEALSEFEICKEELNGYQKQKKEFEKAFADIGKDKNELEKLQKEQDELLDGVFKGSYGSDRENELEAKLDNLLDRQQRIKAAHFKWTNARVLVQHAVNQLGFASTRWMVVACEKDPKTLYIIASETRNNLVAAKQNLENAQKYIGETIEFPYCKKRELETLNVATVNIYGDMQPNRHGHAAQCYTVTYKRSAALLQWFDQVINQTISKDLKEANQNVSKMAKELKSERIRLLRAIAGEEGQEDVNIDQLEDDFNDDEPETELSLLVSTDETSGDMQRREATPMPLKDLAAPPSNEEIFGNMEQLKQEYAKMESESKKTQEFNKARIQQGLEEKLAARRNRRNRMQQKCE